METVLIEIHNSKAYKLLADLEELKIITIVKNKEHLEQKLSDKYLGSISATTAEEMQAYISQSRDEWNRNI